MNNICSIQSVCSGHLCHIQTSIKRIFELFDKLKGAVANCFIRESLHSLFSVAGSGNGAGYLALRMSGKPSERSAAVFRIEPFQEKPFAMPFGRLFCKKYCILARIAFGGLFRPPVILRIKRITRNEKKLSHFEQCH